MTVTAWGRPAVAGSASGPTTWKGRTIAVGLLTVSLGPLAGAQEHGFAPPHSLVRLQSIEGGRERLATAVLVRAGSDDAGPVLFFLTGSAAYREQSAEGAGGASVDGEDGFAGELPRADLGLDIAILTLRTTAGSLVPARVSPIAPDLGDAIVVAGLDAGNPPVAIPMRVTRLSTRFLGGDRDLSSLPGCAGAPAFLDGEVVGIVTACEPGRAALIARVDAVHAFLNRRLPGLVPGTATLR